ncbi:MAG: phosphoenolpyruvate synthase [Coriobacteriales bacterium]|nr:phosphoenolpyruvate synthase [Coriobacteriales bacterium]
MPDLIRWFSDLGMDDVGVVGGKNASLGEMVSSLASQGVPVPDGFATTSEAYWLFIDANGLRSRIGDLLEALRAGKATLAATGSAIRKAIRRGKMPEELAAAISEAYAELGKRYKHEEVDVAVRSSATAEDLPDASFAGQQETFLNVTGADEVLDSVRACFASLFTDRAISYRDQHGFDHLAVALSAGVQKMVRSDLAGAGVMFTIDTETGFPDVVIINAAWGLGEFVVLGVVTPDEYRVFKPLLGKKGVVPIIERTIGAKSRKLVYGTGTKNTKEVATTQREQKSAVLDEAEIVKLATWGALIEKHYERPMYMEWAKDGEIGELFIVQARPETFQSRAAASAFTSFELKETGKAVTTGLAVGSGIATGRALVLESADEIDHFEDGAILVTGMTDPDWVPIMKRASAIVTDHGGRTSHAAIVSREFGLPAIVGTGNATRAIANGQEITVSCAEGEHGVVYDGILAFEEHEISTADIPETRTRIMMNIASPAAAERWWRLPAHGIGLARMEFVITEGIRIHPMALAHFEWITDPATRREIRKLTEGYTDMSEYFVERLAEGLAQIAATQYPDPVVVRMSDFKTNEYRDLIGGRFFESTEANPMIGFRGASRYYDDRYRDGFLLECEAIRRVRERIGLDNVIVMIPFCRTVEEADKVLAVMKEAGLERGVAGLKVYVMAEIPSNIVLADKFSSRFDGFSIGSNDLTQLTLGVDRDSGDLAPLFSESDEAVKRLVAQLIETAHAHDTPVGICGQAPSDDPEFAAFLVRKGIDSISLNPDSVIPTARRVAEVEAEG